MSMMKSNAEDNIKLNGDHDQDLMAINNGVSSVVSPPGPPVTSDPGSNVLSPASLHPSLLSSSLSPGSAADSSHLTLQVPGSAPAPRPSAPAQARRGTNVAVSKRTRFALHVQKPTGENSDNDSLANISLQGCNNNTMNQAMLMLLC